MFNQSSMACPKSGSSPSASRISSATVTVSSLSPGRDRNPAKAERNLEYNSTAVAADWAPCAGKFRTIPSKIPCARSRDSSFFVFCKRFRTRLVRKLRNDRAAIRPGRPRVSRSDSNESSAAALAVTLRVKAVKGVSPGFVLSLSA